MSAPIHILSLGAGVQSSTLALMAAHGEITPMPKCAIFADTQAEPQNVYNWLAWLEKQLPFPVHRVTAGNLETDSLRIRTNQKTGHPYYTNIIPFYVKNADGSRGIVHRKCTVDYKIVPLHRLCRKLARVKRGEKRVRVIQWIGISLDEAHRMRDARDAWTRNRYPLIELRLSRHDCLRWMQSHKFPTPPRSACVFCPFHNDREWLRLKTEDPAAFQRAVDYERHVQHLQDTVRQHRITGGLRSVPYLHDSLQPLDQIEFSEKHQPDLFGNECEGMCGV